MTKPAWFAGLADASNFTPSTFEQRSQSSVHGCASQERESENRDQRLGEDGGVPGCRRHMRMEAFAARLLVFVFCFLMHRGRGGPAEESCVLRTTTLETREVRNFLQ